MFKLGAFCHFQTLTFTVLRDIFPERRGVLTMFTLEQIDPNFKVETTIDKDDITFYDVRLAPFKVYGLLYENGKFRRFPESVAASVSEGVLALHAKTTGGRVRFKTDSPYVAIHAEMPQITYASSQSPGAGNCGFDLYVRKDGEERYVKTFLPPWDMKTGYESIMDWTTSEVREITIHFPRSSEVSKLYIGLSETAALCEPEPYAIEKPIVYYGSSITQGGCSSRAGTTYTNIVSRRLNVDHINLGFSGSAKGETEMAEYIKDLDMSVFVLDYDHNAANAEHLLKTHEPFFSIIRKAHPDLPILIMSRPAYYLNAGEVARLEAIRKTYQNALDRGDTNVYFLDGPTLMADARDDGTVDGCHPTDVGFFSMANAVCGVLNEIFSKR